MAIVLWDIQTVLSCSAMLKASVFWDVSGKATCGKTYRPQLDNAIQPAVIVR